MDWRMLMIAPSIGTVIATFVWMTAGPASAQALAERAHRGLVEIISGGSGGTTIKIAEDLATVLDDGGTRRILPVVGKGALQNVADLKLLRGVDVALIQSDVLEYVRRERIYPGSISYIAKLYDEEFHLLAREEIRDVNDLAGRRVNFGASGDGTSITGPLIFERLKIKIEVASFDHSLALEKLRSGEIAALAYVAGKPAPFFSALTQSDGFHLVPIPLSPTVIGSYVPTRFTDEDYPDLVRAKQPVHTVAVGVAMMVANLVPGSERYRNVANFVEAFFTQFARFQEPGRHPKWRDVNLSAELPGWSRFPTADAWLKRNVVASAPALNEQELRTVFSRFLDERSRFGGGRVMSAQEKDDLFDLFRRWQERPSATILRR